jgi:hypothetical protein
MTIQPKSLNTELFHVATPPSSPKKSLEQSLTEFFDECSTPKKKYPVRTASGVKNIEIQLSPTAKKTKSEVIYRFKQKSTGKKYIGVTSSLRDRTSQYHYSFRHPKKDVGKTPLAKAVQGNATRASKGRGAENFDFGIVFKKEDLPEELQHLSMKQLEKLYINHEKAKKTALFNKRSGGGGGDSRPKAAGPRATKEEVDAFVETLHEKYTSPQKSYPISPNTLTVKLTPSAKGKAYVFKKTDLKRLKNHKITEFTKRYIGKTERDNVSSRLGEHSAHARNEEKEIAHKPFYRDLRNHPEQFRVQVIDTEQFNTDDPDVIERGLIQYYKEKDASLYNTNKGGGGGYKRT